MSALRLARGFTGRSKIVKFEGCYHGHGDSLLVKAGSGALTFGQPSSAGVPPAIANETLVLPYNDLDAVDAAFRAEGDHIACIIVEPIVGNMNLIMPRPGFLQGLRAACDRHGAVLIFDPLKTIVGLVAAHLVVFFVNALMCHGELARRRPAPAHLTAFYLWMSAGGMIGVIELLILFLNQPPQPARHHIEHRQQQHTAPSEQEQRLVRDPGPGTAHPVLGRTGCGGRGRAEHEAGR